MAYLTVEEMKLLIDQIDTTTKNGYRDYVLIYTMYESAARVSEICNIKVGDIRFSKPYCLQVLGKGNKYRSIPVSENLITKIQKYLEMNCMTRKPKDTLLYQ